MKVKPDQVVEFENHPGLPQIWPNKHKTKPSQVHGDHSIIKLPAGIKYQSLKI